MKTVARNRKALLAKVFAPSTRCLCYSLAGGFSGVECPSSSPRTAWEATPRSRLIEHTKDRYTLHCHSNLWYQLFLHNPGK